MAQIERTELEKLALPGPEHERLQSLEGTWNLTARWWMEPDGEPLEVHGTGTNRMILGGRFLEMRSDLEGNPYFRDDDGQPSAMESRVIYGFDKRSEEYFLVGFDTLGTYSVTASGAWDEDRQAIILHGEDEDPALGVEQKYDMHLHFDTPDRVVWDIVFHTPDGGETKVMEVVNTRIA